MKVNPVGKKRSEVDRAYTAGFLDADGAIMATIEKHQEKRFGYRIRITVKITQRDLSRLRWFRRRFQIGILRCNRTTYDWIIRDQVHSELFLRQIVPFLKVKRTQALRALALLRKRNVTTKAQFLKDARAADALSKFNVRSKNRRKNYATMVQDHFSRND